MAPNDSQTLAVMSWPTKLGLLASSALLLSGAFAPVGQFYLAWLGLVPWLIVVAGTETKKAVFAWSWLGGVLLFAVNMWWLWKVTVPGMIALIGYLALFYGFAGLLFRGLGLLVAKSRAGKDIISAIAIALVWTALEWVRGNWSMFGHQGLPWLFLGATQSNFLHICQVADIGGVYAVSFWVMFVNAMAYFIWINRRQHGRWMPLAVCATLFTVLIGGYGAWRMMAANLEPGPAVLVVQPSYPQSNSGEKGAPPDVIVRFHLETTRRALDECRRQNRRVDLVVWSETMMPPMNREFRELTRNEFVLATHDAIAAIARENDVALLVGGMYFDKITDRDTFADRRNSAYFFERTGRLADVRYDKIHLVPFGEFIPFQSIPWLYRILMSFGPQYYEDYILTARSADATRVFELMRDGRTDRFVVAICFEDLDGPLLAKMLRNPGGGKRGDFIVNITNDGWFMGSQLSQHLQSAVFRSIENRAPTARAVNTGISGFIDSMGRVHDTVMAGTEGWELATLQLDPRVTFYTRHGDAFVYICVAASGIMALFAMIRRFSPWRVTSK